MATVLGEIALQGSFAYSRTYGSAPNPVLHLDGVGTVGLPMGEAQCKAVIEKCIPATFGKGERKIATQNIRDTWDVDISIVQFRNPDWEAFVSEVVRDVCEALGVNYEASKPRSQLHRVLVHETGSQ